MQIKAIKYSTAFKWIAFSALAVLIIIMGAATFLEHKYGTPFAVTYIYNAWWFFALWILTAGCGIMWLLSTHRPWRLHLLHISLVVILCGAAISFFTSRSGQMHLRRGESTTIYADAENPDKVGHLPFSITLKSFKVAYHSGTDAAADYASLVELEDKNGNITEGRISMNNVLTHNGVRFYQMSYDSDGDGSILTVRMDRWGMGVSYTGYSLFFIALLWMLIARNGSFRRLLRSPLLKNGAAITVLAIGGTAALDAATVMPRETADAFGRLLVVYNGRVCPMQTLAQDFTSKLYGAPSYGGYSAEQVVTGWLFWPEEWKREPMFKVKSHRLREEYGLEQYESFNTFFFTQGYRLGPLVEAYYAQGDRSALCKDAADIDEKIMLVMSLRRGEMFKMFPIERGGQRIWVSPTDTLGRADLTQTDSAFIRNVFTRVFQDAQSGNYADVEKGFAAIAQYQRQHGGESIPSDTRLTAERLYNAFPVTTWMYRICLAFGVVLLIMQMSAVTRGISRSVRMAHIAGIVVMVLSFAVLTAYATLRGIVSGRAPLGNGYETMLAIAWGAMLLTLLATLWISRKSNLSKLFLAFGFLVSGFFLLVSSLGQMNPAITPLVPVLNSPLLSVHVSLIMVAYMLLSFTFLCAFTAVVDKVAGQKNSHVEERMQVLSRVFLMPALTFLGMGIFIGAVWAGESWGRYWGWDPKETWALITMLVYALPAHVGSLPWFRRPMTFHVYMLLAFATVLMTYFGVNYYLTGLHSYAG